MRVFTDDEQAIRDEIEHDAAYSADDDYNPFDDPDVHIPCDRCHERDACAIIAGVVVCDLCYPAERAAWIAERITPELIDCADRDLDDVPFD